MNVKISASTAFPLKVLRYTNDKAILNDTFNMFCIGKDDTLIKNTEFLEHLKISGKCESIKSRKYYHFKISPKEKNIDPQKLIDYGGELLTKYFNNGMATLSVHNDNGRNHLHIVLSAVNLDYSKVRILNKLYDEIKTYAQEDLAKKYGMTPTTREQRKYNHQRKNIVESNIEKGRGQLKMSEIQFIKSKTDNILSKDYIKTESDLTRELKVCGIKLQTYKTKNGETKYSYKTERLKYGVGEDKLGDNYSYNQIKRHFEQLKQPKALNNTDELKNLNKKANELKEIITLYDPTHTKHIETIDKLLNDKIMPIKTKIEYLDKAQLSFIDKARDEAIDKMKKKKVFSDERLKVIDNKLSGYGITGKMRSLVSLIKQLNGMTEEKHIEYTRK